MGRKMFYGLWAEWLAGGEDDAPFRSRVKAELDGVMVFLNQTQESQSDVDLQGGKEL